MEWVSNDGHTMLDVTCCRLFDGKLSVRYNGKEVALLPNRLLLTAEDIERAIVAVVLANDDGQIKNAASDAAKDAYEDAQRDLFKW